MSTYRHTYTPQDALEAITGPMPKGGATSRDRSGSSWSGATVDGAIDLLRRGYIDAVDKILIEPNLGVSDIDRPEMLWSETGSDIDVAAYLQGIPESMGEMVNQPMPKPLVRIGVDSATACNVGTDQMFAVGRSVLTVVESLRARGYPTEIWSCVSVKSGGATWDGRCIIQSSDAPVHVGKIAFWTAHPAALRRAWFALMETCPDDERRTFQFNGGTYGYPNHDWAKGDFDEWAPSPQLGTARAAQWISEVLGRRV